MVEETQHTAEGHKALISPPEGFDAYNARHPAHDEHGEHGEHEHIHIPPPSYWPLVLAITITIMLVGILAGPVFIVLGALLMIGSMLPGALRAAKRSQMPLPMLRLSVIALLKTC